MKLNPKAQQFKSKQAPPPYVPTPHPPYPLHSIPSRRHPMIRRHGHTGNPSLDCSSNPNSSTTSHFPSAGVAAASRSRTMSDDDDRVAPPFSIKNSPSSSPSPSPSPPPPCTDNKLLALPPPPILNPASMSARTPVFPAREDCWSEAATHTLVEAWGSKYVELNRGNLRHQQWQEVADAVNALHGHTKKQYRTDIQCKNRIDTLKKKYKIEKARVSQSQGLYVSTWPFFSSLNALIGVTYKVSPSPSPETVIPQRRKSPSPSTAAFTPQWRSSPPLLPPPLFGIPVGFRSKRPAAAMDYTVSRRNFSAMAAAAAAASEDSGEEDEEGSEKSSRKRSGGGMVEGDGYRRIAEAIGRFGEIYERVEKAKQRQMLELEKQRMQFAKDLEIQRMKLIMESQLHLQKLKRSKPHFTSR